MGSIPLANFVQICYIPAEMKILTAIGVVMIFLVGLALIANGWVGDIHPKSMLHQQYNLVRSCTGFVLMALGVIAAILWRK